MKREVLIIKDQTNDNWLNNTHYLILDEIRRIRIDETNDVSPLYSIQINDTENIYFSNKQERDETLKIILEHGFIATDLR